MMIVPPSLPDDSSASPLVPSPDSSLSEHPSTATDVHSFPSSPPSTASSGSSPALPLKTAAPIPDASFSTSSLPSSLLPFSPPVLRRSSFSSSHKGKGKACLLPPCNAAPYPKRELGEADSTPRELPGDLASTSPLWRRATGTGPVAEGYPDCSGVGNDQLTCYPNSTTTVVQDEWSKLIWNFNYPLFIAGNDTVDVYLYRASDDTLIQRWTDLPNPEGQLAFSPTEEWWDKFPSSSTLTPGQERDWEAYFIIKPGGSAITGNEVHQATFIAQQTALPTASAASLASVSARSTLSSASLASLATASIVSVGTGSAYSSIVSASIASMSAMSVASFSEASFLSTAAASASASRKAAANGSLQGNGGGNGFPKWAIALVSVLGALLLLAALALAYILVRRVQRRRGIPTSVGSTTPMIHSANALPGTNVAANAGTRSGLGAEGAAAVAGGAAGFAAGGGRRNTTDTSDDERAFSPHSPQTTDYSHSNIPYGGGNIHHSPAPPSSVGNAPSLSGADAASISAAYRAALSQPNFDQSPEGNTPEDEDVRDGGQEVLRRELERQGVKVQGVKGGVGRSVFD